VAISIKFGLTVPQRGAFFGVSTISDMLAMVVEADRLDLFTSAWVGDSLFAKPRPDSLTLLGALAGVTDRLTLGVGCMASFPGPVFTPDMVESWTAAGTPQQCVAHLRELAREGAQAITLRITGWDQKGQYQRMVNEVLPNVNE